VASENDGSEARIDDDDDDDEFNGRWCCKFDEIDDDKEEEEEDDDDELEDDVDEFDDADACPFLPPLLLELVAAAAEEDEEGGGFRCDEDEEELGGGGALDMVGGTAGSGRGQVPTVVRRRFLLGEERGSRLFGALLLVGSHSVSHTQSTVAVSGFVVSFVRRGWGAGADHQSWAPALCLGLEASRRTTARNGSGRARPAPSHDSSKRPKGLNDSNHCTLCAINLIEYSIQM
jgi:hypothetical protein